MTALEHDYVPGEHAPDPVTSHGDPTMPGKVGIWLFLASEIMFFIGILGTYIIYRSGSPDLFARHGETLSKWLAGVNTVVLIFSSLTMALAVDAAQRRDRGRLVLMLAATVLCAAAFMGIKFVEYRDKYYHHTIVAPGDDAVVVKADPGRSLYVTLTSPAKQVFNRSAGAFERSSPKKWAEYVIPLDGGETGTYTATLPAAAAGPGTFAVYARSSAAPSRKDKKVKPASLDYSGGVFVYDGHAHLEDEGETYAFTGWRAPYPKGGDFDLHRVSESDVKAMPGAREVDEPVRLVRDRINADTNYGPWKNNFFASYFTLTGVHGVHVLGGMVPLTLLLVQAMRGRFYPNHTEYTGLYWHFVDLVWIFLFPLLYLI